MARVVDHLVLVRDRTFAIFGHEVLHAAVAARRNLPLELQIEVVEGVDGDDVAAALGVFAFRGEMFDPAVLDDPALGGKRRLLEAAPAGRGLAVEKQPFTRGLAGECRAGEQDDEQAEELAAHQTSTFH